MGRPTHGGGRSPRDLPVRDWIGGYRPRLRAAARPAATWVGVDDPQPAPYLAPTLEEELLDITESHPGDVAGVVFGYAGRDATGPYVVALRVLPFPQVEPLEGGLRVPRQSWWALSRQWQEELPELEPVGWFRIQPGRGTSLGSYDRFTAYQRFADPLQFSWVLDPQAGRQALYRWAGSDLTAVPGYWRCVERPHVPRREEPRRPGVTPVVRRTGTLAGLAALKPWLVAAAAVTVVYLALPFAPGSIPSRLRPPASGAPPEATAVLERPASLAGWGDGGGASVGSGTASLAPFRREEGTDREAPVTAPGPGDASLAFYPVEVAQGVPPDQPSGSGSGSEAQPAHPYITYQVRRGETLWRISLRLLGDPTRYVEIAELNGIKDPHRLAVGQVLRIPADLGPGLK